MTKKTLPRYRVPKKIKTNKIQCRHCGDTIDSKHVHDFRPCSCGTVFVDGGHEYLRRGYKTSPEEDYIELSEYEGSPAQ